MQFVAEALGPSIGEAGGEDPALSRAARESGVSPYRERYEVSWSDAGIFLLPAQSCFCLALLTPVGEVLNEWSLESRILTSASGSYVLARDYEQNEPPVLVDVSHPAEVSLDLPERARPVAWINGSLLYTIRNDGATVQGDPALQTGIEFEEQLAWSFIAQTASLQLWQYNPGGDDTLVFETEGYDFGVVRPTIDNMLLVSVITSNFDAITALNNGATLEEAQALQAHPVTYFIDGAEVVLTIDGGQPDYSSGTFTVVSPQ